MKKLIIVLTTALILAVTYSCNDLQEPQQTVENIKKTYCISPERAVQNVMNFLDAVNQAKNADSRASENYKREVSDIGILRRTNNSRFREGDDNTSDTLLYIVNFKDSAGFAISGALPGSEPIYAIVDSGNFNVNLINNETNEAFKVYFFCTIEDALASYDSGNPYVNLFDTVIGEWKIYNIFEPKLITKWGQGGINYPNSYGKYCPNKTAGCEVIAAAQILSYFRTPNSVVWHDDNDIYYVSDINWTKILLDASLFDGKLSPEKTPRPMDQVAHLCRYLGMSFNAEYKDVVENGERITKTTVNFDKAVKWFKNKSGLKATNPKDFNESDIASAIRNNNIVLARGDSNRGHAWVIDGLLDAKKDGKDKKLFHCNWGFYGNKNGYYLSKVFNADLGPEIEDGNVISRGTISGNFRYNLRYSIISK